MDGIMRRPILALLILAAILCATAARGEDKAALQARLDRVNKLTALDDSALKPWNMKISFQIDDDGGKLKEQGTLEEWWAGPSEYKISIVSLSYTATTIVNKDGRFRTAGVAETPYLLEVLERQMVHPMPHPGEVSGLSPETLKLEGATGPATECIMLGEMLRNVSFPQLGLLPTYCLVPGKDLLQASFDYGNLTVERKSMGMFQQKVMPIDIRVTLNAVDAASSHLLTLKTAPLTDADFALPTSGMEPAEVPRVHVSYRDLYTEIVATPPRDFPEGVKPDAMSAPVQVHIRIGTDGSVHFVRLDTTPDVRMAAPALWMASQMKFTPHHQDGKLVEVETTANIYFSKKLKQPVMQEKNMAPKKN
jgi:hypothetical protein